MAATKANHNGVLTINGGSSSIKFALYELADTLKKNLYGEIENMGSKSPVLHFTNILTGEKGTVDIKIEKEEEHSDFLINWLQQQDCFHLVTAIGHRLVHGMLHTQPELITTELLNELKAISAYDPEHLPGEIKLIEAFGKRFPSLPQVACFDTAFHTSMPQVASLLPLPRRYYAAGIRRYGFHGLSYSYLLWELNRIEEAKSPGGRIIIAHLGNGASLAAIKDGKSVDTSMGFTPTSGLPMGTRTGDLDPGVALYLMQAEKMTPEQFNHLINHESGLLGISEISADMRELLQQEATDSRAAEAIELFCYQTRKWIGAFAAVLGGVDTLVFSGGIGAHAAAIRNRICAGLQFIGIKLDVEKNESNEAIISTDKSAVMVRVIETDEEVMIARFVCRILNYTIEN